MMKKLLFALLFIPMVSMVHAQYRSYKDFYDVKDYKYQKTDRYSPATAAILSIMPGVGHFAVDEPLKGLGYLSLGTSALAITLVGASMNNEFDNKTTADLLMGGGISLFAVTCVSAICNASRIAKVKNMHLRDQKLALHLYPCFQSTTDKNLPLAKAPALRVSVNF